MANILMFDGPDGIGKTTLVDSVHDQFSGCVVPSVKLRFPTGELREKAKSGKAYLSSYEFLSDIAGGLSSAMAFSRRIICDRSFVSTMAYQGCTMDTVKEYFPPILFNDRMFSISLFRLYMPAKGLAERIRKRNTDVVLGLKGAAGLSDEIPTEEAIARLDERYRMVFENITRTEPWKSNPRFRVFPVDMSHPADVCLNRVLSILDNIMF